MSWWSDRDARRGGRARRPAVEALEERSLLSGMRVHALAHGHAHAARARAGRANYVQTNLVSDGSIPAAFVDTNLVNPWGLVSGPTSPFWVGDNGKGVSTLYNGAGKPQTLVVTIPTPSGAGTSAPTGIVFNNLGRATDFPVGGTSARFLFSTEDGTIAAWAGGTTATLAVDRSGAGAVYKGLALANSTAGSRLYATDFHNGTVDVWDGNFKPVALAPGAFTDPRVPAGYAPFGIANVGGNLVVTYAQQQAGSDDEAHGRGKGFVDVFNPDGALLGRVGARGSLNAPWGVVQAPSGFGRFSNDLLVGNFGDGRINAFRPAGRGYQFDGRLRNDSNRILAIDGLWGMQFGTNVGQPSTLYFTAGPNDEQGGLLGTLSPE